ncbi:hypothetical protein BU16DRAFT_581771 [Lophium mytilinum]|uniref:Uncharacterized protein n=1 Tax=Lophium mytilinum TaxID=390894 RepID=A0A6A6QWG2_9PEZI|nr:hypothetical protein BU16DRAFT_581771 [Lophium mytilinum]
MSTLEDTVKRAAGFISPFLKDEGNLTQKRDQSVETLDRPGGYNRSSLVRDALLHLQAIHDADRASSRRDYDGTLVAMVYGLIDLVVLVGIIPSVDASVRAFRRPQSVLIQIPSTLSKDIPLLAEVIGRLSSVLSDRISGINPLITERSLVDIVLGAAELAFAPHVSETVHSQSITRYEVLMEGTPASEIVPLLLIINTGPPWLKQALSQSLSLIPLRPHGVQQLLRLLSDSAGSETAIAQEAVTQVTKLIILNPPPPATRDERLRKVAPRLWDLLHEEVGPEMSKAAGQIIADILSRKSLGPPDTIGWELFAQPLLDAFNPKFVEASPRGVLVSDHVLLQAVKSLDIVTTSHPHSGLAKRLISPIILQLWGLLNYAKSRQISGRIWQDTIRSILLHYFHIAESPDRIDSVASNLLYDGEPAWTYGPGSEGGIEIRRRARGKSNLDNLLARLEDLKARVSTFVELLQASTVGIAVFQIAMKRWLSSAPTTPSLTNDVEVDPLEKLLNATLCEAMARKLTPKFEAHPEHAIQLARTLLGEFVEGKRAKRMRDKERETSMYASLGKIVQEGPRTETSTTNSEEETVILFSLSILETLISDPDFKRTVEIDAIVASVATYLALLSPEGPQGADVDSTSASRNAAPYIGFTPSRGPREDQIKTTAAINNAAKNLLSILSSAQTSVSPFTDPLAHFRSTLKTALSDLQSSEPPICAHALFTIKTLASSADTSSIIDIPSTTQTIISLSLSHPDSFVHTAAIPPLIALAALHPALVTEILTTTFLDEDESTLRTTPSSQTNHPAVDDPETTKITTSLDLRLRIAETLSELLSAPSIWTHPTPDATRALQAIITVSLTLASRRGPLRPDTLAARTELAAAQARSHRKASEAWGGDIPSLSSLSLERPASASETADEELNARIVAGWQDTGVEEDIRIRASALAVLGKAFEERWERFTQEEVDKAVEIVLGCLVIESGVERAMLRRAAVLVVLGVLKGLDDVGNPRDGGVGLAAEKWAEVEGVLKRVGADDEDELVKGHVGVVLEELDTWRRGVWFGMRSEAGGDGGIGGLSEGLEGGLRGLAVVPGDGEGGQRRSMIQEVELLIWIIFWAAGSVKSSSSTRNKSRKRGKDLQVVDWNSATFPRRYHRERWLRRAQESRSDA